MKLLSNTTEREYEQITCHYFEVLNRDICQNNFNLNSVTGELMVISEYWRELIDKEVWLENIYKLLCEVKKKWGLILAQNDISSFNGLGDLLFTVCYVNDKTSNFRKFYYSLREISSILLKEKIEFIRNEISRNNLKTEYYDLSNGLAGIGMFYLNVFDLTEKEREIIKKILECLIQIHMRNKKGERNWFIRCENQIREEDRIIFRQGSLDLGLAHGIVGVALFLSKAYSQGIIMPYQEEVIMELVNFYLKIGKEEKGIWGCPSQLGLEDFITKNYSDDIRKHRMSWCYGSLGILRAFQLIGRNMKNVLLEEFALKHLLKIAVSNISDYKLESPILCHGYAGLIVILNLLNLESPCESLENRLKEILQIEYTFYNTQSHFGFKDRGVSVEKGIRKVEEVEEYSLLNGSHGILLSLHSLVNCKSDWEQRLFVN